MYSILFYSLFLLVVGCERQPKDVRLDNLNAIKVDFLQSILKGNVDESPFHLNYSLRTVFFSSEIISVFGELQVYSHLPHGWAKYEGKTYCRISGEFQEIKLGDLFPNPSQKEFLRSFCEDNLKTQPGSYFSGQFPVRSALREDEIKYFVLDDQCLIIFFQPYTIGGLGEGLMHVRIPYNLLKGKWKDTHPILLCLDRLMTSKAYTVSSDF
ncbi:MAG TPA: hypothetical protein PKW79_05500 [Rhabdochlamydiaceae bacterium]|nr:hypothetical protein [Rhabdochlamydiaceae bacterium]